MIKWIKNQIKLHRALNAALRGEYKDLLTMMIRGEVKWHRMSNHYAVAAFGRLVVEHDWYYYFRIDRITVDYITEISRLGHARLECAAINSARISRSITDEKVRSKYKDFSIPYDDFKVELTS